MAYRNIILAALIGSILIAAYLFSQESATILAICGCLILSILSIPVNCLGGLFAVQYCEYGRTLIGKRCFAGKQNMGYNRVDGRPYEACGHCGRSDFAMPLGPGQPTGTGRPCRRRAGVKVLVLPFGQITPEPTQTWIAWAIQQNLAADLSQTKGVQPLAPADLAAADAWQAGTAGAAFVIVGGYQVMDQKLRVTGLVLNVRLGTPAGGLKASGSLGELFDLEDTITAQVRQILPQPPSRPAARAIVPLCRNPNWR